MTDVMVLGAEAQAATSIACAYPKLPITFVSDQGIIDGSDLPNVRMTFASPKERDKLARATWQTVPLCPRWLGPDALPLSEVFDRLERRHPGRMLAIHDRPPTNGRWIIKGDHWHRPDAPLSGTTQQLADVTDPHGCGLVYQPCIDAAATIMAIGRREHSDSVSIGLVAVFQERFFRNAILQAGETVEAPDVLDATFEILDLLDHRGFFTLNWLQTKEGPKLSSLRAIPRAIFQAFLRAGVDLLRTTSGHNVAAAGIKFIAAPTYVSFRRLSM
jgi:hypothetical protein